MSDVNLDFTVNNNSIGFTVAPNDITITPNDIQLSFYNAPRPSAGGAPTELQYNLGGDLAGIPTATYSSNVLNISNTVISNANISNANINNANLSNITSLTTTGNVSIGSTGNVLINNASLSNVQTFTASSYIQIKAGTENVSITNTPTTGTVTYNLIDQAIIYNTANLTGNLTLNFVGNGTTTLNSLMSVGNSMVGTYLTTVGANVYSISNVEIDGSARTIKWVGGSNPYVTSSALVSYTFTLIKTASNTYTVLGSSTRYI